jgi:deoxyribose-phosphate aldolase
VSGQDPVDRLVDVITQRVEAELRARMSAPARSGTPAEPVAPCATCSVKTKCDSKAVIGSINLGAKRVGTDGKIDGSPCGHVAPLIDHTLLKPEATKEELRQVCDEARKYGFATVCVNSANIPFVARQLEGSSTKPIAVVGFPLGAASPKAKAFETKEAIRAGAKEIDMVVNIGALKSRDHRYVLEDIEAVVDAAGQTPVKVIIETSKLSDPEKVMACTLAAAAGAAFVKTSTGFAGGGATPEDVALMRSVVGEDVGVKASGGIRTIDDVEKVIAAGANRIGASSSVAIVQCVRPEKGKESKSY